MSQKTNYEKRRDLIIAQNNARLEASGVHRIKNKLEEALGVGKKSKDIVRINNEDVDYSPSSDDEYDDDYDDDLSEENLPTSLKQDHVRNTNKQRILGCDKVSI